MKLISLLHESIKILREHGVKKPKTDAETIISSVLGISKVDIYVQREIDVSEEEKEKILKIVRERASGEPLEYLLGYKYFWGMKFIVDRGVLIPRFDTETLVHVASRVCKSPKSILDIGTGTGIIGITLKKLFPNAYVIMTDISDIALENCKKNVKNLLGEEVEGVEIIKVDIFENLWSFTGWGKFDLVISNPPYISEKDMKNLEPEVKKEPITSLYGGPLGIDFYLRIADKVKKFITDRGKIILEVGDEEQAELVKEIFKLKGFRNFLKFKDLSNQTRGIVIFNF